MKLFGLVQAQVVMFVVVRLDVNKSPTVKELGQCVKLKEEGISEEEAMMKNERCQSWS